MVIPSIFKHISQPNILKGVPCSRNNISLVNNSNLWKSTSDVTTWFKNLGNLRKARFLKFDIVEFYPSITPELLDRALNYAESLTKVTDEDKEIIRLTKNPSYITLVSVGSKMHMRILMSR